MKNKTLSLVIASVFALVFLISFTSAIVVSGPVLPTSVGDHTVQVDITEATANATITFEIISNDKLTGITFEDIDELVLVDGNTSGSVDLIYTIPDNFNFEFGEEYNVEITVEEKDSDPLITDSVILTFEKQDLFCAWDSNDAEETDDLSVKIKDVSVEGFGDDNEWFLFDEVEVEIEIENKNNDYDIDDIVVEWGLYNWDSGEWTIDVDDEKDFSLKDGEEETIILNFKVDDDLEEDFEDLDGGDFILYVRATGEVDDDEGAYDACASDSEDIEIIIESDFVIVPEKEIEFLETVSCDSTLHIDAEVWNLGDDDQDDVEVRIYSETLGINKKVVIGDIDAFDSEKLTVDLKVPADATEQTHTIRFSVYDDDGDIYENDYDDEESITYIYLTVEGSCTVGPKATVSAKLESGGMAGEELVVRATLTNAGAELKTYSINAAGYAQWADAVQLSQSTLALGAGESADILFTFNVNKDVSGLQAFDIEVLSGNELELKQPVQVTITEKAGFLLGSALGDNWYVWGIGALNLILIIIIIVVAVRVARK